MPIAYHPEGRRTMSELTREEVDQTPGAVLLEFGAPWCPHCQAIQTDLANMLAKYPEIQHISVEDGKGKPLGRSFRVKLWPTLVFLRDSAVVNQLVRPSSEEINKGFAGLIPGR
jgi:thioredoxin 1